MTDTIKQIRVFVGLILQPEMDPPKIVPDPTIKIERDESSQSHHTETTLLPSGIKQIWGSLCPYYNQK